MIKLLRYIIVFCITICIMISCDSSEKRNADTFVNKHEVEKMLEESNIVLLSIEEQEINDFIERHDLEMEETGSGLRYRIVNRGNGKSAEKDMTAVIDYKIRLLTGDVIYSSKEDGIKEFSIGRGGVESGLEEGILLLNKGDKAIFIMPAHLAHGVPGDGIKIPKRAAIVYDIELIDLK